MPLVEVNGARVSYADTGAPTGNPDAATVVFGHGLLFGGWMFRAQIAALREDYRCVTIDWRGQGDTPATDGGYDMDTLTGDAAGVIKALDVGPVHWVGLSMGGFVGMRLAARHGELLRSLTLLDTSAGGEDPEKIFRYKLLSRVYRLVGIRPLMSQIRPIMFGPTFVAGSDVRGVVDEWIGRLSRCDRNGIRKAILAVCDRVPIEDEIARITVPTLVAVGDDDIATPPARAQFLADRIPGAELVRIEHCGHSSSLEQPEEITRLLRRFLTGA